MRQTKGRTFRGEKITAATLKNKEKLQQMIQKDEAYRYLKQVRGTPSYWQKVHYDVLAMIRQLGVPTWFLTLSAADMKWPDVLQTIGRQYGEIYSDEDVNNMTWQQKTSLLRRNPVTAARHFQYRLNTFWKDFLLSKANPIGEISDYMMRIEFQARGSPHAHCVVWVKNAPRYGIDSEDNVTSFIDKYQTCHYPEQDDELRELVHLQKHAHSSTCMQRGVCRFNIPKQPSPMTLFSTEPIGDDKADILKHSKDTLAVVKETIKEQEDNPSLALEQILEKCEIKGENYLKALKTSRSGNVLVLQRSTHELSINSYNPEILRAWRANMDIQYILDAYACVMYITSYMMKSERQMSQLLKDVCNQSKEDDVRKQLRKVGTTFLNHREVSAQEAAYRLLSLPLKNQSRKTVFINTDSKENRTTMTKPLTKINNLEDDDEDLYQTSLIDRYAARPDNLENMTLAEFAANYNVSYGGCREETNDHTPNPLVDNEADRDRKITLKNNLGHMYHRKQEAIIRFHKFNKQKEREKYYRSKIMLYVPWRQEDSDILAGHPTFESHFAEKVEEIRMIEMLYTMNVETLDQAIQDLHVHGPPEDMWANIAPTTEHEQMQLQQQSVIKETHLDPRDLQDNTELLQAGQSPGTDIGLRYKTQTDIQIMSHQDYCEMMRKLNKEQRKIITDHRKWCKELVAAITQGKPEPSAPLRFILGSAGVGKSHCIRLIQQDTIKLLRYLPGVNPDDVVCMLTAPTGTAAFNIDGMTIHSALSIGAFFPTLGSARLNTLQSKLSKLRVLVIDEVSMVGSDLLYQIHDRLDAIKGTTTDPNVVFGNISIIAVGDLFQLKPVKQPFVFENPSNALAQLCPLWDRFQLTELTQVMRQKDDRSFAEILNRVRTADCTRSDIEQLKTRELQHEFGHPNYPNDAFHVFVNKHGVKHHNDLMMKTLEQQNTQKFIIKSHDSKRDKQTSQVTIELPDNPSSTGGLEKNIRDS